MDLQETKRHVLTSPALPALSQAAWEALRMSDAPDAVQELAAIVSFDPALSARIVQEARKSCGDDRIADVERAMERLGAAAGRTAVLRHAISALFPPMRARKLDRHAFWREAFAAGSVAEWLAERTNLGLRQDAFVAGLLHDIGLLVIDIIAEDGYSKPLETAHGQGLFVLEAERQEYGVDHTLAGKWLAERWGLSAPLTSALWLHHHPPGTLDQTAYPVSLIDLTAVADALGRRRLGDSTVAVSRDPAIEERLSRLGLSPDILDEFGRKRPPVHPVRFDAETPASQTASATDTARLRHAEKEGQRYRALYDAMRQCLAETRASGVLRCAAEALRGGLGIPAGLCYRIDAGRKGTEAAIWRPGSDEILLMTLPPGDTGAPGEHPAETNLLRLLRELSPDAVERQGLMAVPMSAAGRDLAQIVFDTSTAGIRFSPEDVAILMSFAGACGQALAACDARDALAAQTESLGEALWMREVEQQKKGRTERLASVARMAAGAAHEINNPLAIISGRAQILMHRATEPNDAQALRTIVEQSQRASKVLGDLIQFARPAKPKLEEARIEDVLRRVVASFKESLSKGGMAVHESYAPDLPAVPIDRHQMEQALGHLAGNAIEAMAPAGGVLTVSVKPSRDRRSVLIQISDTGHGIPNDIAAHVFDPFFTTREGGGHTGLGLAVCHGIIESHRGSITIHSQPRKETSVTVTLPAAVRNTTSAAAADPARTAPPMILLADGDDELCEVLAAALTNRGFAVRYTSDPLEAMAALIAHPIGLVLIDLHLNATDGAPLWHRIRQRHPNVPLVALAPQGHTEDIAAARRLGARACIEKPFGIEALLQELKAVFGSRGAA